MQNNLTVHLPNTAYEDVENLNALDKEDLSLLHRAVRANDFSAVNALLDNGADIDIKGRDGFTPLHGAVRYASASEGRSSGWAMRAGTLDEASSAMG